MLLDAVNHIRDHSPDLKGCRLGNRERRILVVLGYEHELPMALRESLDGEFAIDHRNNDTAIAGCQCTIYNEHIPGVNPGFTHRLPRHPDEKGCCRVLNEVLIEVQGAIEVVIGWG